MYPDAVPSSSRASPHPGGEHENPLLERFFSEEISAKTASYLAISWDMYGYASVNHVTRMCFSLLDMSEGHS